MRMVSIAILIAILGASRTSIEVSLDIFTMLKKSLEYACPEAFSVRAAIAKCNLAGVKSAAIKQTCTPHAN